MNLPTLLAIFAVLILLVLLFRKRSTPRRPIASEQDPIRDAQDGDDFEDFNEKFLRNPQGKEGRADLVRTYNPIDLALIRSLLDSEGIESFVQFSNMGELYPTIAIPGFTDSVVIVYPTDLKAAKALVQDFLSDWEPPQAQTGLGAVAQGLVAPSGSSLSKPELLAPD